MNTYLLAQLPFRKYFSLRTNRIMVSLGTFTFGAPAEWLQHLGLDFLGSTFDPLDLVMYALGVCLGPGLDISVLDCWEKSPGESFHSDGKLR